MRIHSKYFPPDIRYRYKIEELIVADGYVYIKIIKVMYGIKQAAIIAYNQLISHMEPHGYYPVPFTTGLWAHKTRKTNFCLCVDDFGVKKIIKGIYGLKQADIKAYNQLISHMDPHGYYPVPFTTVLWAHKTRKTKFCLCVDDFGVKCFSKDYANHLLNSLKITMQF